MSIGFAVVGNGVRLAEVIGSRKDKSLELGNWYWVEGGAGAGNGGVAAAKAGGCSTDSLARGRLFSSGLGPWLTDSVAPLTLCPALTFRVLTYVCAGTGRRRLN